MEENKSSYLKWVKSHKLLPLISDQKTEYISKKSNWSRENESEVAIYR